MNFVNLHNHTNFSILQALPSPKELFQRANELKQFALALTDNGTLAGVWDSYKAAKSTGIKLIVGLECYFLPDSSNKEERLRHLVLLAQNATGYKNLLSLNRRGFDSPVLAGRKVFSVADWKSLEQFSEGLTCLTGSGNGIIGYHLNNKDFGAAETDLKRLIDIFGIDNLGAEVQPHRMDRPGNHYYNAVNQVFTNHHLINLAIKLGVRVVPTSNTYYLRKEDHQVHDVLLAVGAMQPVYSNARLRFNTPDFYLKTYEEVKAFFTRDYTEEFASQICDNTLYFADKSSNPEWVELKYSNPEGKELPVFNVTEVNDYNQFKQWWKTQPTELQNLSIDSAYLRFKCFEIFEVKFKHKLSLLKQKEYINRIEEELSVLDHQGFSSYLLIVSDYVNWAKNQNILQSSGRGSIGGVLIAYLLGIHKADPIKYNLIFARFQNREKLSPPDIDQDFPTSARDKVIKYIQQKYGNDKVAFISNFSRITPKVYARDIARSLEFGNDRKKAVEIGDAIADAIPKELKNSASFEDLKGSPLFYEYVNTYPKLAENAPILGGIRNYSLHAAALVIGRRSLSGLVPLRTDKDGNQALEYEKNNAEDIGLLKVDILGLSTLDLIESTINLVNKHQNTTLCMDDIKFEDYDKKTYDLITAGDTFGVFQLGTSGGTIDLCKKVKPRSIQDLAIITTLARPAAAAIREVFIKARENKKNVELLHPSLENSFGKTYGFCLYDETYLQLGQDVAGWNLNQSDRIRKMIKDKGKNPEKDQKLRAEFIDSAANKINRDTATKIWDQHVSSAASYTFNLSHAILYSFTSFITAYLKAHYPTEFLLANLMADVRSNAPNAEENISRAKLELRFRGVKILPPDLNKSEMGYHLLDDKTLLTGLDALKFVGDDAIEDILAKRPFHSFEDFMRRIDTRKVRSSTIQALAAVGCLDIFNLSRRSMYQYCVDYRKKLGVWVKKKGDEAFAYPWNDQVEWILPELFALEKQYLGESFICSKKDAFGKFFKVEHADVLSIKNGEKKQHISNVRAEIKSVFALTVKKEGSAWLGHQMAKLTIEDVNGVQCGLTIFPEQWAQLQRDLKANKKLAFEPGYAIKINGTCNLYENEMGFVMENLTGLEPPPALPKDLKMKKIAMASPPVPVGTDAPGELEQSLEDQLFNEGLIDLDDTEDSPH